MKTKAELTELLVLYGKENEKLRSENSTLNQKLSAPYFTESERLLDLANTKVSDAETEIEEIIFDLAEATGAEFEADVSAEGGGYTAEIRRIDI